MKLRDETIQQIRERVEIEEVVSDFVSLKRKGQNLWACCPFHNEKTPSFSVAPNKGIYKCFGCGAAGDAIQFVMDVEGLNYIDALKYLARKYGIEIQEEALDATELKAQNEKESLHIVLGFAGKYFQDLLWEHPDGKAIGLSYFKERGYNEKIIKQFELGYAIEAWDGLVKAAEQKGYNKELLEKAGLVINKEDRYYDRFRGRVIFPIHSVSGKVIAFGARILKAEKNQPKYINSPETTVYHKSNILYGMHQARQAIRQAENCYLVEGYTDVISLHLAGVENVVASSGTSLTDEQIKLIGRYTDNITVLFDGDAAGMKASLRGIDMILEKGLNVRIVIFPEGEDPDSFSKKLGSTAFADYLKEKAEDFISYKTALYTREAGNDPIKKAETIKEIVGSIAKVPDPLKRAVYLKQCSDLLNMEEGVLITELNKLLRQGAKKEPRQTDLAQEEVVQIPESVPEQDPEAIITLQEKESIRLLINYGFTEVGGNGRVYEHLLNELEEIDFQTALYKEILKMYKEIIAAGRTPDPEVFIQEGTPEIKQEVINLISEKYEISENWKSKFKIYVPEERQILDSVIYTNVLRLKFRVVQKLIVQNMQELKQTEDFEEQERLLDVHMGLKAYEKDLADHLGIVVSG